MGSLCLSSHICVPSIGEGDSKLRAVITSLLLANLGMPVMAQECDPGKPATAPLSRFKGNGNGTITDTQSKQVWLQCALGMKWNGSTCEGQ